MQSGQNYVTTSAAITISPIMIRAVGDKMNCVAKTLRITPKLDNIIAKDWQNAFRADPKVSSRETSIL